MVETPAGQIKEDPGFGWVEVWYDNASVVLPRAEGNITITWQGCQEDGICYAPITSDLSLPYLTGDLPADQVTAADQPAPGIELAADGGLLEGLADRGGTGLVLLAFFGFGLALALTPCVFSMVPILAGMLARQGEALTARRGASRL